MTKKPTNFTEEMEKLFEEDYKDTIITEDDSGGVVSTGLLSLDVSIGVGGIPRGKVVTIFGPESAGKSTLALNICKHAISNGEKALYIDVESQMDFDRMCELIGPENVGDSFILAKPQSAEKAFKVAEAGINHKDFSVIVFDTVAALSPEVELAADFEDSAYAPTTRLINRFMRRNGWLIRRNKIALVFVNQIRDTIGSYVKFYSMPGGHALKHYSSIIIYLSKKAEITHDKEAVGIVTEFTLKKNKVGPPFRSYKFPIMFDETGIDEYRDVVDFSEMLGIVRRGGAYYKFGEITLGSGFTKTMEFLKSNPEVLAQIREECYNRINKIKVAVEVDDEEEEESIE
jgi:recombination protein RecA